MILVQAGALLFIAGTGPASGVASVEEEELLAWGAGWWSERVDDAIGFRERGCC